MITLAENVVIAERFRLIRLIGRGGMGSVWQAHHLGLDMDCAVKFIEGEFSQSAEAKMRFEREAKAAAQLRSPHVVQIFDHGVFEDTPYIAMELLRGQDLAHKLQASGGRLPPADVGQIVAQVCRALTKAHAAGIVHRDLKPENIWIAREDDGSGEERDIVKVLDFGIAKKQTEGISTTTKTGSMLGTPYYMSPEQAQGVKAVDARADLWGLAVIVFQCITGRLPFESDALGDLLLKIIVNPLPVPSQVQPSIPPGFDRWWGKAASREPAGRFQTAKEFSDSLMFALGVTERRLGAPAQGAAGPTMPSAGVPAAPPAHPMQGTPYPPPQFAGQMAPHNATPMPSHLAQSAVAPMNATPNPMRPVQASVPGFGGTFNGAEAPAGIPPKKSSLGVILGGVAVVAILAGGGVGLFVAKSRGSAASGAASAQPTTTTTSTGTGATTAEPTSTATATATATTATAEPATSAAPSASVAAADPKVNGGAPTATGAATAKPVVTGGGGVVPAASAKPVASAKPAASATAKPAGSGDKWGF